MEGGARLNIEVQDEAVAGKVGPVAVINVGHKMIVGPPVMFLLIKDHDIVCDQMVRLKFRTLYEPADPINDFRVVGDEPGVARLLVDDLAMVIVPEYLQKGIVAASDTGEALHLVLVEKHRVCPTTHKGDHVTFSPRLECPNYRLDNLVAEGITAESFNHSRQPTVWAKKEVGHIRKESGFIRSVSTKKVQKSNWWSKKL